MKIVRSNRKSMAIELHTTKGVIVRVPLWATKEQVEKFIDDHRDWLDSHIKEIRQRQATLTSVGKLSMEEVRALADEAMKIIPERVKYYADKLGVTYGRITIRNQRSRCGSCNGKKNLNFNCLLMSVPPEIRENVVDSVVVHELCHLKEMNHSERFYAEVLKVFPDYWKWHGWLKENGEAIMAGM